MLVYLWVPVTSGEQTKRWGPVSAQPVSVRGGMLGTVPEQVWPSVVLACQCRTCSAHGDLGVGRELHCSSGAPRGFSTDALCFLQSQCVLIGHRRQAVSVLKISSAHI